MMVVYLSMLLVIEIIYLRIMRLLMNDEPGEDLGGSGSGFLSIIILSAGRSGVPFPTGLRKYALLQNVQTLFWDPDSKLFSGYLDSFPGLKRLDVKLSTHLHLAQRFRMSGAVPPFPLCAVMMCTGTTLPSLWQLLLSSLSSSSWNRVICEKLIVFEQV
jgi:hypothetical protein